MCTRIPIVVAVCGVMLICTAASSEPSSASSVLADARAAMARGQADRAASLFESITRQEENVAAELGLVRATLQSGAFRQAMSLASLTAGEHEDVPEAQALLAWMIDRTGRTEIALKQLRTYRAKRPDAFAPMAAEAEILVDRAAEAQAKSLVDEWKAAHPGQHLEALARLERRIAVAQGHASTAPLVIATEMTGGDDWGESGYTPWPPGARAKSGNGVIIDDGRAVLTLASAVPRNASRVFIRNGRGVLREARPVPGAVQGDLVVLELSTPYPATWSVPRARFAKPDGVHLSFVLGYAVPGAGPGSWPALTPGTVLHADTGLASTIQITAALTSGHAGSPLFDARGRLVGIALGAGAPIVGGRDLSERLGRGQFALPVLGPDGASVPVGETAADRPLDSPEATYESLAPAVVEIIALR